MTDRIGSEDAVERLAAIRTPDRVEEIRRRRAAIVEGGVLAFDLPTSRTLLSHVVADIDYLLADLEKEKAYSEDARLALAACGCAALGYCTEVPDTINYGRTSLEDTIRLYGEKEKLRAEVERLQVSEQALTLRLTASLGAEREGDQEIVRLQAEVERLRAALAAIAEGEYCKVWENMELAGDLECPGCLVNDALCGHAPTVDPLQQLTDLDQSRYEEADNPLVKEQEIERLRKKQREERIAAVRADLSINFGYDGEQEDG